MKESLERKAVIYCRVSTKEQVEEGNSLQTQEKICKDYALKNGYEVAGVFIEQGESAKTAQRTELQKLLSYCSLRKNSISAVIAYKLDRISRNTDDYSQIRLLLKRYGVEIKSTSEYFENTPAGRFMENIIANVAQFDNDVRTERCVGGMKEAIREGRYVWRAPIGYSNSRIAGKSNIQPNHLAPLIKMAFEEVAKGISSINAVHRLVNKTGLTIRQHKPLYNSHFYAILRNELYAGWINKFGERHKGIFDPIVSEALFRAVQYVLNKKKRVLGTYAKEIVDFPLRRFIRNTGGALLSGSWSKGTRNKYPYYRFSGSTKSPRKDELELAFQKFLDKFALQSQQIEEFQTAIEQNLTAKLKSSNGKHIAITKTLKELKEKETQLIEKNLKGIVNDLVLKEQLDLIEKENIDLNLELSQSELPEYNLSNLDNIVYDF